MPSQHPTQRYRVASLVPHPSSVLVPPEHGLSMHAACLRLASGGDDDGDDGDDTGLAGLAEVSGSAKSNMGCSEAPSRETLKSPAGF